MTQLQDSVDTCIIGYPPLSGNICRSPTAEAVFRTTVEKAGLQERFEIDSCGTGGGNPDWYLEGGWSYHEGDPADPRMTLAGLLFSNPLNFHSQF